MLYLCNINRLFFVLEADYGLHEDDLNLCSNWMEFNIREFKESGGIPALL
jgi:hypothetical protein